MNGVGFLLPASFTFSHPRITLITPNIIDSIERDSMESETVPAVQGEPVPEPEKLSVLYTGITWLDLRSGGFRQSEVAHIECPGSYMKELTSYICVQAVRRCENEMIFVDGGCSLDPYRIAAICKRRRIDRNLALSKITVSRAFTAYQMATIINDRLPDVIEKTGAPTVLVSCMLDLFLDRDMVWNESHQMVNKCMASLKTLAVKRDLIVLVTDHNYAMLHCGKSIVKIMNRLPDKAIQLNESKLRYASIFFQHPDVAPLLCPDQRIIDGFGGRLRHG